MGDGFFRLTVLGTRGSTSVSGSQYAEFGCSTSCYLVEANQSSVILDAGSGLAQAPVEFPNPPAILLSHWHLDHLTGLGMYERLLRPSLTTYLYGPAPDDEAAKRRLDSLYSPPYWPVKLEEYQSDLHVRAMPKELRLGDLRIRTIPGNHPGGCLVYRITFGNKSLVYATDYEHEQASFARLVDACRGADLVLYDAQYTEGEYATCKGFGHSTASKGIELMRASGAKRLLLIHHSPSRTDDTMRHQEALLSVTNASYAREGETIVL